MDRRHFLLSTSGIALGITTLDCFSIEAEGQASTLLAPNKFFHFDLIKSATLAPSSHNTQPWKFHTEENLISIFPDFSRRCPIVDPDNHHLFVSLGCATENLVQTALAQGKMAEPLIQLNRDKRIEIHLSPTKAAQSAQFQAIQSRQCTRLEYDGKSLTPDELRLLERSASGNGVHCHIITEKGALEKILEFVVQGNTAQMIDPAFVEELKGWVRFNSHQAEESGDGLYSATNGSPSLPTWLGKLIFSTVFTPNGENDKYSKQLRSSAGIAIFTSEKNDIKHWIEVGRRFERFALQATVMGVRTAMLNQPVEVSAIRPVFSNYLGIGTQRPDLVVRFGRGPLAPRSMRRPVEAILI